MSKAPPPARVRTKPPGSPPGGAPAPKRARSARPRPEPDASEAAEPAAEMMPDAEVGPFFDALGHANPNPKSDLAYTDPFSLLVAVVLSAQTTDAAVNRATPALFAAAPTPAAIAALGAEGIGPYIRSIGLWQGKARNVAELARRLVADYGGEVPRDRDALEALPGVGRKTANVVLNVAFGEPTMAVDTHVFRVANRTGLASGATPRAVEDALVRRVPAERLGLAHHWLILHGRYCCKARTPECWRCVVAPWCRFPRKSSPPGAKQPGAKQPGAKKAGADKPKAPKPAPRETATVRPTPTPTPTPAPTKAGARTPSAQSTKPVRRPSVSRVAPPPVSPPVSPSDPPSARPRGRRPAGDRT